MYRRDTARTNLSFLLSCLLGLLFSFGFQPGAAEPEEPGGPSNRETEKGETTAPRSTSTDLMPLEERNGFFLLYKEGEDPPQVLPFTLQQQEKNEWVLTKKNRVKHWLKRTEDGTVAISAETDLNSSQHVTYDPPVPLLPTRFKSGDERTGTSTIRLHDHASGPVTDTGTCEWTLKSEGPSRIKIHRGAFTAYRLRLKRRMDLGTFRKATLTTVFDFVPGLGQVQVRVNQDARVLGLIGPNEDWRIERGEWVEPQFSTGPLLRETTTLFLDRYERARDALANGRADQALRALRQIERGVDRVNLSITDLNENERSKAQPGFERLRNAANRASNSDELEMLRNRFREVSRALRELVVMLGHNRGEPVRYFQCAADVESDRRWLGGPDSTGCPYLSANQRYEPGGFAIQLLSGSDDR